MRKAVCLVLTVLVLLGCLAAAAETAPAFPAPYLIMSAGQSADAEMVKVMMTKLKIDDYTLNSLATAEDVVNYGTLIVAVGGSSKGLGAAGIDADQELARVSAILDAATEAGVKVLALHIGGSARRGELSDKFIEPVLSKCQACVVVAEGNTDGLFDQLAETYSFTLSQVEKIASTVTPLGELLTQ